MKFYCTFVALFLGISVQAQNLIYDGTLLGSNGSPIEESGVKLKAEILDDGVSCVLYEREFSLDLSNSSGHFSLDLSNGTAPVAQPHSANTLTQVLSNASGNSVTCADSTIRNFNGSFVKRQIRIRVLEINTVDIADIQLPAQELTLTPFANEAETSKQFTGSLSGDVTGTSGATLVTKIQGVDVDTTNPTDGQILKFDNSSSKYVPATIDSSSIADNTVSVDDVDFASSSGIEVPTLASAPGAPSAGQIYYNSVDNKIYFYNGSGWVDTGAGGGDIEGVTPGTGLSGGGISGTVTMNLADTSVTAGAYGSSTQVPTFTVDAQGRLTAAANVTITDNDTQLSEATVDGYVSDNGYLTAQSLDAAYDDGATVTVDNTDVIFNLNSTQDFHIQDNGAPALSVTDDGNIGIGTNSPNTSALLDVSSVTKGFLPPRMTTAERDGVGSPAEGLTVFNTTTDKLNIYAGGAWTEVSGGSGFGSGNSGFVGSLKYTPASNCEWATGANNFTNLSTADSDCNAASIEGSALTPTEGKIPAIRFANLPAGRYRVMANSFFLANAGTRCHFRLFDGTTDSGSLDAHATNGDRPSYLIGDFAYTSAQTDLTFYIQAMDNNTGTTCSVRIDNTSLRPFTITVTRIDGQGSAVELTDADGNTKVMVEKNSDENIIRFDTAGSERMVITASGEIGVGTASPSEKLEVAGTVKATAFEGDGSGLANISTAAIADNSITVDDLDFASSDGVNIPQLASDPSSPTNGQMYYNTTSNKIMVYNGSSWTETGSGSGSANTTTYSSSNEWTGATGSFTFGGSDIDTNSNNSAIRTVEVFEGDFTYSINLGAAGTGTGNDRHVFGVYPVTEDGTFNQSSAFGGVNTMTSSWWIGTDYAGTSSNNIRVDYAGTSVTTLSEPLNVGDTLTIKRSGTTITFEINSTLKHTWTQTTGVDLRLVYGTGGGSSSIDLVNWTRAVTTGSLWSQSGTNINYNSGNVGIGTTTPSRKLEVSGGHFSIADAGKGVLMKSPDGTKCSLTYLKNSGSLGALPVDCATGNINLEDNGTAYQVAGATFKQSCNDYLTSFSEVAGFDGSYMIDPDGAGGNAEFEVYCDMTTEGGGWTLVSTVLSGVAPSSTSSSISPTSGSVYLNDTDYGTLKTVSTSILIRGQSTGELLYTTLAEVSGFNCHSFASSVAPYATGPYLTWGHTESGCTLTGGDYSTVYFENDGNLAITTSGSPDVWHRGTPTGPITAFATGGGETKVGVYLK